MPAFLRESLLFPYTAGLSFVQWLQASGGWDAVDGAFREPPASTEQVLHPEKYAAHEAPVDGHAAGGPRRRSSGRAGRSGLEDTLGEFQLKVWLDQVAAGSGGPSADAAAAGWGGDRVVLLDGPERRPGDRPKTAWDTRRGRLGVRSGRQRRWSRRPGDTAR